MPDTPTARRLDGAASPGAAIEARGLVKRYGTKVALTDFDLTVPAGTVTALLGPNGAGKTTAVRILTTLSEPDGGRATVAGHDVVADAHQVRRRIGLTAQDATVDPLLTGRENLVMLGRLHQQARARARERAAELLADFDLLDAADRPSGGYSGGMRRRLDLAATLVNGPEVLFLDEPTTGLDPRSRLELWGVLDTLVHSGTTVLLTTQYLDEAERLADEIVVVDHGRIVAQGDARSLKRRVGGDTVAAVARDAADLERIAAELGALTGHRATIEAATRLVSAPTSSGLQALVALASRLEASGIVLDDLSLRQPTLDEAFLALTGSGLDAAEGVTA